MEEHVRWWSDLTVCFHFDYDLLEMCVHGKRVQLLATVDMAWWDMTLFLNFLNNVKLHYTCPSVRNRGIGRSDVSNLFKNESLWDLDVITRKLLLTIELQEFVQLQEFFLLHKCENSISPLPKINKLTSVCVWPLHNFLDKISLIWIQIVNSDNTGRYNPSTFLYNGQGEITYEETLAENFVVVSSSGVLRKISDNSKNHYTGSSTSTRLVLKNPLLLTKTTINQRLN